MAAKNSSTGVLNPDLTVKGVEGLRVIDASVFVSILLITSRGSSSDNLTILNSLIFQQRTPNFLSIW